MLHAVSATASRPTSWPQSPLQECYYNQMSCVQTIPQNVHKNTIRIYTFASPCVADRSTLSTHFAALYAIHAIYSANTIISGRNERHVIVSDDLGGIWRTAGGSSGDDAALSEGPAGVGRSAEKMWVDRWKHSMASSTSAPTESRFKREHKGRHQARTHASALPCHRLYRYPARPGTTP